MDRAAGRPARQEARRGGRARTGSDRDNVTATGPGSGDPDAPPAAADVTFDAFLGGRFRLFQPRRGFRSGSDALLLGATVPADAEGVVVDLGSGPGAIGFSVAARAPAVRVALVDVSASARDLVAASLARPENAGLADRIVPVLGDVRSPPDGWDPPLGRGEAGHVLMNPPFFASETHREAAEPERRTARSRPGAGEGGGARLSDWFAAARRLLSPRGRLALVMPAAALPEILALLSRGFGAITVYPLFPRAGEPAGLVIVAARRDSRRPLALASGLVLHGPDGSFSAEVDRVLRAGAGLPGFAWG